MATKVLILTTAHMRTTERFVAVADPQNIQSPINGVLRYYFSIFNHYIFTTYDSVRGITLMRQKRLDGLREI